jgi:isochorismate pyruvate lyase
LGLEPGTDILVLFHFHRTSPEEVTLQLHPRHDPERPLSGVFATRSQFRPNAIGATVAHVVRVEDRIISVINLDAQDGTPVLDIKPYVPYFDVDTKSQQLEVRSISSLQEARQAIDLIDAEVIRLLGNRAGYVRQVPRFKKDASEVRAPDRYAEVMRQRREMAEVAGLNPDVIEEMYRLLVENFIKEEVELIKQREAKQWPS